jgi:hypothetical protein
MHALPLDPAELAELAELIECLSAYTLDLGQVDIEDEDRPRLDRLHAILGRLEALQRGEPVRPSNVPGSATPTRNPDGSTTWTWDDGDDCGTMTVDLPPCRPVLHVPGAPVPIPAPIPAGLTATDHERIGNRLADVLHLTADRSFKPPRYVTTWGSKTAQGLGATVARIVETGAPL